MIGIAVALVLTYATAITAVALLFNSPSASRRHKIGRALYWLSAGLAIGALVALAAL